MLRNFNRAIDDSKTDLLEAQIRLHQSRPEAFVTSRSEKL